MQWLPAGDEQCSGSPCGTHQLPVMPWLLARHMPGSDSHQVRQGTTSTGDTRPAMTPGVARSACEAQDTCQSPVPRMAGTVSPQLPGDTQLPVGTGWRAQCTAPSALCSWRGAGAGQAVLRDRDTIAGLPMPPSGGQQGLGGHSSLSPGCWRGADLLNQASLSHHPLPPAARILTDLRSSPARPASSPPTLAHPWRLCKAPPRQGQRNLLQVQLVNHIKSSPVESLGVHPARGEHRELVRDPQLCRELQPPETSEAALVRKSEV